MSENLLTKFTPETMAKYFPTIDSLQGFLTSLSFDKARYQSKSFKLYAEDGADESVSSLELEAKEKLERDLPAFRQFVEDMHPDNPKKPDMESELHKMESDLKRLQDKMEGTTAFKKAKELLALEQNAVSIQAIDALADHVGAWFEEGHLGPGTVQFNDKKFVAG